MHKQNNKKIIFMQEPTSVSVITSAGQKQAWSLKRAICINNTNSDMVVLGEAMLGAHFSSPPNMVVTRNTCD